MFLEEITNSAVLENREVECKSLLNRDDVIGWMKTVAGFANASGGVLFIGVEDKTNKLIGFDRVTADNERNYFNNQLNEHLSPRPQTIISFIPYLVRNKERFIMKITVYESAIKPVILKYQGIPGIFMRREGYTNGATYEEIIEMSIHSRKVQYDTLISDISYDRSRFSRLLEYYRSHNNGRKLTDKALRSMGFFNEDGKLANGAVLFMDDYREGKTAVQCSVFNGFNKGSERIITVNRFNGNLIDSLEYIMNFVCQRMNHSMIKLRDTRLNIDSYPERALFEGLVNAVAHRDYFLDGTQIQVDMFLDRLEISSPGSFYQGAPLGKTYDLTRIISKRRNELITSILVSCNVMEAAGTGFDKISEEYAQADELHRPSIYSSSDHFTLTLPDLTYAQGLHDDSAAYAAYVPVPDGTVHDHEVLLYCYNRAHKASEIAEHLSICDSTYFRQKVLANLVNNGYLICSRISRAAYYKTNRDLVHSE